MSEPIFAVNIPILLGSRQYLKRKFIYSRCSSLLKRRGHCYFLSPWQAFCLLAAESWARNSLSRSLVVQRRVADIFCFGLAAIFFSGGGDDPATVTWQPALCSPTHGRKNHADPQSPLAAALPAVSFPCQLKHEANLGLSTMPCSLALRRGGVACGAASPHAPSLVRWSGGGCG